MQGGRRIQANPVRPGYIQSPLQGDIEAGEAARHIGNSHINRFMGNLAVPVLERIGAYVAIESHDELWLLQLWDRPFKHELQADATILPLVCVTSNGRLIICTQSLDAPRVL